MIPILKYHYHKLEAPQQYLTIAPDCIWSFVTLWDYQMKMQSRRVILYFAQTFSTNVNEPNNEALIQSGKIWIH